MIGIRLFSIVAIVAPAGCEGSDGRTDPLQTGALGALLGAGAGVAGGAISRANEEPAYRPYRHQLRQRSDYGYSHRPSYRPQGYGYRNQLPPITHGGGWYQ